MSSTTTSQKLFIVLYTLFSLTVVYWVDDSLHKNVNEFVGNSLIPDLLSLAAHAKNFLLRSDSSAASCAEVPVANAIWYHPSPVP